MNFKDIKTKFLLYLQNNVVLSEDKTNLTDLSAKSIFLYQDDFKQFLKDEYNISDGSLLTVSVADILKMNAADENDIQTYGADETDESNEEDENKKTNDENDNWLSGFIDELFSDDDFKAKLDSDKNGEINKTELNGFLDKIKGLDGNTDSISLDDLLKSYQSLNNEASEESEKVQNSEEVSITSEENTAEPATSSDVPNTSNASISQNSNYNNSNAPSDASNDKPIENNDELKSLENMSEEELNQEKNDALAELDKNQSSFESIADGSNSELSQLDKDVNEAYEQYKKALDDDSAKELDRITTAISEVENNISKKEIEISKQTSVVSNAKTTADNAQTTYETMDAAVKALEAQSNSLSEDEDSSEINKKLANAKARREQAKTDAEKAKKEYDKEKKELEKSEKELDDLKNGENGLEQLNKEKLEFESKIDENSDAFKLMTEYNNAKTKYDEKKAELKAEAKTAIETSQKRLDDVNAALNNYKDKKEVDENYKYSSINDIFSSDVKMTRQMLTDEKTGMQYYLMAPEGTDPTKDELPMLLYLHGGSGGIYDKSAFESIKSSPGVFLKDTNFKGYIVCPVLSGNYKKWDDERVAADLDNFLTSFTDSHKVNKDKIALSGVSLGGSGTVYMASKLKKWFCKAAAISPARGSLDDTVPIKLFFGSNDGGNCLNYKNQVLNNYSNADVTSVGRNVKGEEVFHTWAAAKSYEIDSNNDGNSDLLEWLFS